MNARRRASLFSPATWSFATKATVIPTIGLVLIGLVLALLVNQAIREIQLTSLEADFELLSQAQSRRVAQTIVREVSLVNALAQNGIIVQHAQQHFAASSTGESSPDDEAASQAVMAELTRFQGRFPQYTALRVVDSQGRLIATTVDTNQVEFRFEEWFPSVMSGTTGRLYLSDLRALEPQVNWRGVEVQGVEIALPILGDADEPIGVVYALWDVSYTAEVTSGFETGRVLVFNRDGTTIADSVPGMLGEPAYRAELLDQLQAAPFGSIVTQDDNGIATVFGYSGLLGIPQLPGFEQTQAFEFDVSAPVRALGWTVVVSQDVGQALALTGLLVQRVLILLGVGTAVIVVAVFLFSRTLVAPLGRLIDAASRIGAGELDTPIPDLGRDEVGQLAAVLRGMVGRLVERVEQLQAATDVSHVAQTTLNVDDLLQNVTDAIYARFNFTHVRIYRLDAGADSVVLRAASGTWEDPAAIGAQRVSLSAPNLIAEAVSLGQPQASTGSPTIAARGSELAVPLHIADERLGVLHVVKRATDGFDAEDISVMELLADQVSASIQTARLFEESENSRRYIEALNRRLTREAWLERVGEGGQLRYALRGEADGAEWPQTLSRVAASGEPVIQSHVDEDGQAVLALPISLRGEVIGTLGIRRAGGHQWTEDEIALVQAVGERVALIAEDIRLLETADRTARREQTVGEVSARLQRATELDSLLQLALNELSGALGSDNISLRIGSPPADSAGEVSDGSSGKGQS